MHGVTIGTNAILEGKGAEVWMLVTHGFRDVLEIARTNRPVLYDIRSMKPPPLVPRTRTVEVAERIMFDGGVLVPLDAAQLRAAAAGIPDGPDVAIAICFLHSYANPAHERTAKAAIEAQRPGRFVCASSEVLRAVPRVRALQHDGAQRLHRPADRALSRCALEQPRRPGLCAATSSS